MMTAFRLSRRMRGATAAMGIAVVATGLSSFGVVRVGSAGPVVAHADNCYQEARTDVTGTFRSRWQAHVWYITDRCDTSGGDTDRSYEIGTDVRDHNNTSNYLNVASLESDTRAWSCGRLSGERDVQYNNSAYVDTGTPSLYYGSSNNPCGRQADGAFRYTYSDSKYTTIYVSEQQTSVTATPQCPNGGTNCSPANTTGPVTAGEAEVAAIANLVNVDTISGWNVESVAFEQNATTAYDFTTGATLFQSQNPMNFFVIQLAVAGAPSGTSNVVADAYAIVDGDTGEVRASLANVDLLPLVDDSAPSPVNAPADTGWLSVPMPGIPTEQALLSTACNVDALTRSLCNLQP